VVHAVVEHVSYLREHSVGSILRSSFRIYRQNFRTLFLIYCLPTLPFLVAQQEAQTAGATRLTVLTVIVNLFVSLIAFAAITVAISDMCLGERPGVIRAYRRLGGAAIKRLAWASLLQVAVITAGMLVFVVPGIILSFRLLFTSIVATLENCRGRAALKRSAALGKGFHWRNFGVLAVLGATYFVLGSVLGIAIGIGSVALGPDVVATRLGGAVIRTVFGLFVLSLYPLLFTAFTLMYYDLRVRKEAYDLNALAEDLRR